MEKSQSANNEENRSNIQIDYNCSICFDSNWVRVNVPFGHPRWGTIEPCKCWNERNEDQRDNRLRLYSNLNMLKRFTFDTLDTSTKTNDEIDKDFENAVEYGNNFAENPQGWMIISGPTGSGKTHLAAAIAHKAYEKGYLPLYLVVPDLLDEVRRTGVSNDDDAYINRIDQISSAPVLFLDDMGGYGFTSWGQEKILQILNYRYNMELPTVIVTVSPIESFGERLRTRLTNSSISKVFNLPGITLNPGSNLGFLPKAMQLGMTFDTFEVNVNGASNRQKESLKYAFSAALNYAKNPEGQWMLFTGGTGVGKTHLVASVVNYRNDLGKPVFFTTVAELLDHMRHTFAPNSDINYDELFDLVKNTELLILDDFGSQGSTVWAQEKLYHLLVHRHNSQLSTMITMEKDEIVNNPKIASRISDPRFVTVVEIEALDYRTKEISVSSSGQLQTDAKTLRNRTSSTRGYNRRGN